MDIIFVNINSNEIEFYENDMSGDETNDDESENVYDSDSDSDDLDNIDKLMSYV